MIREAELAWELACRQSPERSGRVQFMVQDVMRTTFPSKSFDAVVCNRLFHHLNEARMRQAALSELARICSGQIVVFYFDRFALDTLRLSTMRALFGRFRRDRIPIATKSFAAEAASVGLSMERVVWTRWGISPQAYAVFR
jgi:ubiquinone/menaquinone biosynthesis C-methylase UbiE